jgi:hypothetical protein
MNGFRWIVEQMPPAERDAAIQAMYRAAIRPSCVPLVGQPMLDALDDKIALVREESERAAMWGME